MADFGAVIICLGPVLLGIGLVAWKAYLRHKLFTQILEERRLLIEKGVTDLPKLEVPMSPMRRGGLFDLRAGIVFVSVAAGLAIHHWVLSAPQASSLANEGDRLALQTEPFVMSVLACLGLGLICFHFIARAHTRDDGNQGNGCG